MNEYDLLKNRGVLELNKPAEIPREKTVVVLGLARGGTSMVAAVLQALGVMMGEKLGPVLEDVALSKAVESGDKALLKQLVDQRNQLYPMWGWKRPSAIEYAHVWQGSFRNPHIIAVFRDPFAIANRNRISMLSDVFQNMEHSVRYLGLLVGILRAMKSPLLMCSYEKALRSPLTFVHAVDGFLGLSAESKWEEAVRQVNPEPPRYLETSRITHSVGSLDGVTPVSCNGWGFYPQEPHRVARVQLFINQVMLFTLEANRPRPDVKEKGLHPTGNCGFRFDWPEGWRPKVDDWVDARLEGDIKPLKGSPRRIDAGPPVPPKASN